MSQDFSNFHNVKTQVKELYQRQKYGNISDRELIEELQALFSYAQMNSFDVILKATIIIKTTIQRRYGMETKLYRN